MPKISISKCQLETKIAKGGYIGTLSIPVYKRLKYIGTIPFHGLANRRASR